MKMEQTECPETSAYKFHTPGNHPKESIQQSFQLLSEVIKDGFLTDLICVAEGFGSQATRAKEGVCVELLSCIIPEEINGKEVKTKNKSFKVSCLFSFPTCFIVHLM
jgi:hypothetical protein